MANGDASLNDIWSKMNEIDKKLDCVCIRFDTNNKRVDILETEVCGIPGEKDTGLKGRAEIIEKKLDKAHNRIDVIMGVGKYIYGIVLIAIQFAIDKFIRGK